MIFLENRRLFLESFGDNERTDQVTQKIEKNERNDPLDREVDSNQDFMKKLLASLSQRMPNSPPKDQEWARNKLGQTRDKAGNYLAKLGINTTQKMMQEVPRKRGEQITNRHLEKIFGIMQIAA